MWMIDMPDVLIVCLAIAGSLLGLALLLGLLYLLWLVRPRGGKPADTSLLAHYAHRGLHGGGVPENSLAAFRRACEAGYGIELDVQLSRDGEVMVYHDYVLGRMTPCQQKLCEMDAADLAALPLGGTHETIPTFAQVLELVDGRVPLLVELKGETFNTALCEKVAALLRDYQGSYCIESFNPLLLKEIRKCLPDAYCGLLYTNVVRDKQKATPIHVALTGMAFNFLCKPNFIAYNQVDRRSLPVRLTTGFYKAPRFVWTVRTENRDTLPTAYEPAECAIFELSDPS